MLQPIPLAFVLAAALFWGWRSTAQAGFLTLAVSWVSYAVYEYLMYARVLCSGECNIRVDLLLIYPVLLIGTLWVVLAAIVRRVKRKRRTDD